MATAAARPAPWARDSADARRRTVELLAAAGLTLAGLVHLALAPQHFADSALLGATFTSIAALQLGLAVALVVAPGAAVYRAALAGAVGLVALWATARVISPPTGIAPWVKDRWGFTATATELSLAVLLASAIPSLGARPRRRGLWAAAGGVGFASVFLIATGSADIEPPYYGSVLIQTQTLTGQFSITIPAIVIYIAGGRAYLTLPWSTGIFLPLATALIAAQIYLALGMRACAPRQRARRRGTLSLIPALLAAPVCCATPVLSVLGLGGVIWLGRATPVLLIASCVLLALGQWTLHRQRRRLAADPAGPDRDD